MDDMMTAQESEHTGTEQNPLNRMLPSSSEELPKRFVIV